MVCVCVCVCVRACVRACVFLCVHARVLLHDGPRLWIARPVSHNAPELRTMVLRPTQVPVGDVKLTAREQSVQPH